MKTRIKTRYSLYTGRLCVSNAISSLTSGLGIHNEEESLHSRVKVDQAVRPLLPKQLSILKT